MTVSDLIDALYKLDTRLPVVIETADGTAYEIEGVSIRPDLIGRQAAGLGMGREYEG